MNGNFTGYNPGEVEALGGKIKDSAEISTRDIIDSLENGIVRPMSDAWFSGEGVNFFNGFADAVRNTSETIQEAFNSYLKSVESAANNWAENVEGETVSLGTVPNIQMNLDVSSIKDNSSGKIGIIEADAEAVANNLSSIQAEIKQKLQETSNNLRAESAFLGHNQAEAVTECFVKVNNAVSDIFRFLTEGQNNLKYQISQAVAKYADVAQNIQSQFNSAS